MHAEPQLLQLHATVSSKAADGSDGAALAAFDVYIVLAGAAKIQSDAIVRNEDGLSSSVTISGHLALPAVPSGLTDQLSVDIQAQADGTGARASALHGTASDTLDAVSELQVYAREPSNF